jgi:hypothetical protein
MAVTDAVMDGTRRTVSTGSTEIDKKMGGGIPEGSLILIEGSSNAGKSVITQQLVHGALNGGFRCALYTTENTARSLFRQMASLSLDVTDFFLLGALNVYPVPAARDEETADRAFHMLLAHMNTLLALARVRGGDVHADPVAVRRASAAADGGDAGHAAEGAGGREGAGRGEDDG